MRTMTLGIALVALLVCSAVFFAQAPVPSPGVGNPLGPLVSGTDFSGSWRWLNHQDSTLFTAAGDIADWGGIPLNDAARCPNNPDDGHTPALPRLTPAQYLLQRRAQETPASHIS